MALVILQTFYNFCSFSHLPQCFKQFFLYAMLICASTIFQGIELIQTHFTLILMFSFIPSSSSNMSMTSTFARVFNVIWIFRVQSTNVTSIVPCKHSRSFFRLTSELKICTNFPLNFDNFLHVLFPCDFPAFSGLNTYFHIKRPFHSWPCFLPYVCVVI